VLDVVGMATEKRFQLIINRGYESPSRSCLDFLPRYCFSNSQFSLDSTTSIRENSEQRMLRVTNQLSYQHNRAKYPNRTRGIKKPVSLFPTPLERATVISSTRNL